ncbi:hypothetical protein [Paraburkholderia silvatlantica]|uniref:Uncharacterized protein n=1 Tax=Paraburkholderia silvatlantica TaxID=321895 RepID=A0ABR6FXX3_9BURK|nr:hypothetical protein [Paraburkholderia silvatlantica]MBB2932228.1 hypothetical protein [Paraburkholderia silvatlantica]
MRDEIEGTGNLTCFTRCTDSFSTTGSAQRARELSQPAKLAGDGTLTTAAMLDVSFVGTATDEAVLVGFEPCASPTKYTGRPSNRC